MAATLTNPQIGMAISGLLTSGTFPVRSASPTHQNTSTPAVGNSAGQVNRLYQAAFTVASSGSPTSIDLTTLVDIDGTTINFVNIYSIEISNDSVTTGENMTLFGGTNGHGCHVNAASLRRRRSGRDAVTSSAAPGSPSMPRTRS
jgi:hypothetical protein